MQQLVAQFLFYYFTVFAKDASSAAISGFPSTFISASASIPSGTAFISPINTTSHNFVL